MPHSLARLLFVLMLLGLASRAVADPPATEPPPEALPPQMWEQAPTHDQRLVNQLLDSPHWPFRAFAMLRLERFDGASIEPLLRARLADPAWQVRIFALRAMHRRGWAIPPAQLADEADARVILHALRCGVALDDEKIERGAKKLMRTRAIDELMLGLEVASASTNERLRREAQRRLTVLIERLDDAVLLRLNDRLARVLGVGRNGETVPRSIAAWREWAATAGPPTLASPEYRPPRLIRDGAEANVPFVATLDTERFARLLDYFGVLQARDLQLALVIDSTSSMVPMLNETRAGAEQLILFLDDLSKSMQLGVVAYRDHDNPPIWEGQPFTADIDAMREFLFGIRITGGRDLPEAVLAGLEACHELDWNKTAERQIILIGDARPHDHELYQLHQVLEWYRENDIEVHAVHVPQEPQESYMRLLDPVQASARRAELDEHNVLTRKQFQRIADTGGGSFISLTDSRQLVPEIMHLTIEEPWWPAFDEFYAMYCALCR